MKCLIRIMGFVSAPSDSGNGGWWTSRMEVGSGLIEGGRSVGGAEWLLTPSSNLLWLKRKQQLVQRRRHRPVTGESAGWI